MALNLKTDDWINNKNIITQEIPKIDQGMLVKIANNFERFWVKVTEVNDKYLLGSIDNFLTFNENYDYKDVVLFEKNNILDFHLSDSKLLENHNLKTEYVLKTKKKKKNY